MRSRLALFVVGVFALGLIAWGLWPRGQAEPVPAAGPASETPRADGPTPLPAMPRTPPAEPFPAAPPRADATHPVDVAPSHEEEAHEAHGDHLAGPTGDLELYTRKPMSALPHRVVRAWGASKEHSQLGLVGAYVIVEPGMSDAQLNRLARDIQKYHRDAKVLNVRILDSEEAATYDPHVDGGALAERHQVATVSRDPKLGVNEIRVRGKVVEP